MTATRRTASEQALMMLAALEEVHPGQRGALLMDAMGATSGWDDVSVQVVPDGASTDKCSVAGGYREDEVPPALVIADSASIRRHGFTVLHEYGHHLQRTRKELYSAFKGDPDGGFALEEAACDQFAAHVLMPEEQLTVAGAKGLTADDVVRWFADTRASRSALCVHAANRLGAPGHVVLVDSDGAVFFAAAHGMPPPKRASDQSAVPLIRTALTLSSGRATGMLRWAFRDGITGAELYAQVAPIDGFYVVVTMLDHAPWAGFSPPPVEAGPRGRWVNCVNPSCENLWQSFDKSCTRCGVPACPECQRCACPSRTPDIQCTSCWQVFPPAFFASAGGPCRDCAGD